MRYTVKYGLRRATSLKLVKLEYEGYQNLNLLLASSKWEFQADINAAPGGLKLILCVVGKTEPKYFSCALKGIFKNLLEMKL